jgi:hypothetical protein
VIILQEQFRQQRAVEEKYRQERSPEPCASLDSDQEDYGSPQQQGQHGPQLGAGLQQRDQQHQVLCRALKRSRDELVGLAAGSDEEDSAVSRPSEEQDQEQAQQGEGLADCTTSSGMTRVKVEQEQGLLGEGLADCTSSGGMKRVKVEAPEGCAAV